MNVADSTRLRSNTDGGLSGPSMATTATTSSPWNRTAAGVLSHSGRCRPRWGPTASEQDASVTDGGEAPKSAEQPPRHHDHNPDNSGGGDRTPHRPGSRNRLPNHRIAVTATNADAHRVQHGDTPIGGLRAHQRPFSRSKAESPTVPVASTAIAATPPRATQTGVISRGGGGGGNINGDDCPAPAAVHRPVVIGQGRRQDRRCRVPLRYPPLLLEGARWQ